MLCCGEAVARVACLIKCVKCCCSSLFLCTEEMWERFQRSPDLRSSQEKAAEAKTEAESCGGEQDKYVLQHLHLQAAEGRNFPNQQGFL